MLEQMAARWLRLAELVEKGEEKRGRPPITGVCRASREKRAPLSRGKHRSGLMTKPLVFEAWPLCIADRLTTEIALALQASSVDFVSWRPRVLAPLRGDGRAKPAGWQWQPRSVLSSIHP